MNSAVSLRKFQFFPFVISLLITLCVGFSAMLFTRPQIKDWYVTLRKPSFTPPPQLFAPVWTGIYILIASAAYLIWRHRSRKPLYKITSAVYWIQLFLNAAWSAVFFGMHEVFIALVVIVLLWGSIVLMMLLFGKFSAAASCLLWPYLLWVSFAAVLNASIYLLNR